jgi:hypothetical protein
MCLEKVVGGYIRTYEDGAPMYWLRKAGNGEELAKVAKASSGLGTHLQGSTISSAGKNINWAIKNEYNRLLPLR